MSWNYRVVKHVVPQSGWTHAEPQKDTYFRIHEAYDEDGSDKPHSITKEDVSPHGDTPEELKADLQMMLEACQKPVLNYDEF